MCMFSEKPAFVLTRPLGLINVNALTYWTRLGGMGGPYSSLLATQSINFTAIVPVGHHQDGEQRSGVKIILHRSIKDKEPRPPLNDLSWHK